MLVRCPKCRTTYKVSDEILKGGSPAFRCSKCKHTFELGTHSALSVSQKAEENAPARGIAGKDPELHLPFERQTADRDASETESVSPQDLHSRKGEAEPHHDDGADRWSMTDNSNRDEDPAFVMPESDQPTALDASRDFSGGDPFFPRPDSRDENPDAHNILALSSYMDQRASILPFVTLFGLLLIGFTLIAVISYAHPQASENVIKQIPLVGTSVLKNEHLKEGIIVQSLHSGYQTIQGNREVFLITGVVRNQNPVVVQEIRLTGITYNEEGEELERQTIWAGNTISPKIIRGMTSEDIPHLQNLKPLKSFEIPPGDSVPFTIVFLRSAKNAKQFSCEVLTAEGEV